MVSFTPADLKAQYAYDAEAGCLRWKKASKENNIHVGDKAGRMKKGQFVVTLRGKHYPARRVAWLHIYGEWPKHAIYVRDGNPENLKQNNLVIGKDLRYEKLARTCLHCGDAFMAQKAQSQEKFCTRACYTAHKVATRPSNCRECNSQLANADRNGVCDACYRRKSRIRRLANKYGLSLHDLETLLASQGHVCAICGMAPDSGPVVDHNHATGTVRGVLCGPCNIGIGHLGDDAARCLKAAEYLRMHGCAK